ncbi:ABC-three component system middle component 6 [Mycobacterium sp. PDNC021]|uniref:ABC-three component system middle component 6 n=1 Tax=Mycobacterium sp. PDNC021 TaxID=3391399 RepID=UPI003AAD9EF2
MLRSQSSVTSSTLVTSSIRRRWNQCQTRRCPVLLPTKGVSLDRALITVGGSILEDLRGPTSVSTLWERQRQRAQLAPESGRITFDWFSLALAFLYTAGLIDTSADGYLVRTNVS